MENIVVPNKKKKYSSKEIHSTTGSYDAEMKLQNDWKLKYGGSYIKQVLK